MSEAPMLSWNMPPPTASVDMKGLGLVDGIDEAIGLGDPLAGLTADEVRARRERANEEFKRVWKVCELTN